MKLTQCTSISQQKYLHKSMQIMKTASEISSRLRDLFISGSLSRV